MVSADGFALVRGGVPPASGQAGGNSGIYGLEATQRLPGDFSKWTKKTPYWIEVTNLGNRSSDKHSSNYTVNKKGTAKGRHKIYFDSKNSRDRYYNFTQTRDYNFALTLIKSTGKTQGDQLDYFGLQDDSVWKLLNTRQKQRIQDWVPLIIKN